MADVFHIVPASIRWGATLMLLLPLVIIFAVVIAIGYSMVAGARRSTFELSNEGLRLRGDFYGRMIPLAQLRVNEVARIEIDGSQYRPTSRTNGIAVPGYRAGWFRLKNGHKGLLYVTDPTRVVLVPTTDGYDVLLSVIDPDRFVSQLRTLGGRPTAALRTFP